jgi:lipid A 3-O-deacylase PagL
VNLLQESLFADIGRPDLGQPFEFNVQMGMGMHYFFRDNTAVTFQHRWLHFSDGGTSDVNKGVNTQMFEGGLTWFFSELAEPLHQAGGLCPGVERVG